MVKCMVAPYCRASARGRVTLRTGCKDDDHDEQRIGDRRRIAEVAVLHADEIGVEGDRLGGGARSAAVMTVTMSKSLKASRARITTTVIETGASMGKSRDGNTASRRRRRRAPPRTLGRQRLQSASSTMIMNGVHSQASTTSTRAAPVWIAEPRDNRATQVLDNMVDRAHRLVEQHAPGIGDGGRREHHRQQEDNAKEAPEADLLMSSSATRGPAVFQPTAPTTKIRRRASHIQKRLSLARVMKLPRPTKRTPRSAG